MVTPRKRYLGDDEDLYNQDQEQQEPKQQAVDNAVTGQAYTPPTGGITGGKDLGQPVESAALNQALAPSKPAANPNWYFRGGLNPEDKGDYLLAKVGRGIGNVDPSKGITDDVLSGLSRELGSPVTRGKSPDKINYQGRDVDILRNWNTKDPNQIQWWWGEGDPDAPRGGGNAPQSPGPQSSTPMVGEFFQGGQGQETIDEIRKNMAGGSQQVKALLASLGVNI